jgi:hypothetical protein
VCCNSITADVELNRPGEVFEGHFFVLVTVNVVKGNRSREMVEDGEDLEFEVSFWIEVTARVGVLECAAGLDAFEQAFTISIVGDGREREMNAEIEIQMVKEKEGCKHAIRFRAKGAGIGPKGAATSSDEDSIRGGDEATEGAAVRAGAAIRSE